MIDAPMHIPGQTPEPPEATTADPMNQLVERLRDANLAARDDLKVTRHLFRGEPSYIVHDPISFQSHRFSQSDYEALARLSRTCSLGEVFDSLVEDGKLDAADENAFYEFVLSLQTRGLLDLPVTDGQRLFERHMHRQKMMNKPSIMKLLFLRIPLFNPDAFLDRTVHLARPLFTRAFFIIWMLMMLAAGGLLIARWSDFYQPFSDLLATRNLIILFVVMTALKFWHELGHAYACKINGGAVPDMGAFLMAGMPLAYVDVSSSWGFSRRRDRILVGLGGMYFESIAACIAVFIWATTGPGTINSTAHFVVLMASLMTVLFNANPLMRYDGYYILSDMIGIPNLRERSTGYTGGLLKNITLGIRPDRQSKSFTESVMLILYGVASTLYQFWLVLTISMMIAANFFLVGMMMAAGFVFAAILKPLAGMFHYLWFHKETAPVRVRALAVSGLLIAAIVAVVAIVPVPGGVVATGQIAHEKTQVVRLPYDCVLEDIAVSPGESVKPGQVLLQVKSDIVCDQFELSQAELKLAQRRMIAGTSDGPATQRALALAFEQADRSHEYARQNFDAQSVVPEIEGTVRSMPTTNSLGSYFPAGTELIRIGCGEQVVRVLCSEQQIANSQPAPGDLAEVRIGSRYKTLNAVVETVEPAGSDRTSMTGLTQLAGGDIILDPLTGKTRQPWFLVTLRLNDSDFELAPDDMTAAVRFRRRFESIGHYGWRHMRTFFNKLFIS